MGIHRLTGKTRSNGFIRPSRGTGFNLFSQPPNSDSVAVALVIEFLLSFGIKTEESMNEKRQSVSILKLLTGSVMGIVGTIILLFLIAFLGTTGYYVQAVLFVPDLLGLVQHVTPENTYEYASPGTYLIQNLERGDYLIYVEEFYYFPRVTLTSLTTLETITAKEFLVEGERLKINYSQQYQLVGKFTAPASGDYELNITDSPYALRITPDVSKNVDTVFVLGLIIQPLLLYFLFRTIYRWRNREKIAANQKFRDTRDKKFDDWFSQAKKKNNS